MSTICPSPSPTPRSPIDTQLQYSNEYPSTLIDSHILILERTWQSSHDIDDFIQLARTLPDHLGRLTADYIIGTPNSDVDVESCATSKSRCNTTFTDNPISQTKHNEVNTTNLNVSSSSFNLSSGSSSSCSVDVHHLMCGPTSSAPATTHTLIGINDDDTSISSPEIEQQTVDDIYYREMQEKFKVLQPGESMAIEARFMRPYLTPDQPIPIDILTRAYVPTIKHGQQHQQFLDKYQRFMDEVDSNDDAPFAELIHQCCQPELVDFSFSDCIRLELRAGSEEEKVWGRLQPQLIAYGIPDPQRSEFEFIILSGSAYTKTNHFDSAPNRFCSIAKDSWTSSVSDTVPLSPHSVCPSKEVERERWAITIGTMR